MIGRIKVHKGASRRTTLVFALLGSSILAPLVAPIAASAQGMPGGGMGGAGMGGMGGGRHRGQQQQQPGQEPRQQEGAPNALPPAKPTDTSSIPVPEGTETIRQLDVTGNQRLERDTVLSYIQLRPGQPYTQAAADAALKDLYATELFSDVRINNEGGKVTILVKENPVINRIIYEGNKRLKEDKITPEVKLASRQIFTRSKVRADVARIIELYKRQGRFAATVEPKMVQLDQNRVDIVFEINEGPKSKVRQINIIGNQQFTDTILREQMVTKQSRAFRMMSGRTSYDPDRLAYDQQKLRQFYLTQGYADFRVVSAVAELTPDKHDFIITYVVEEGKRYKFGDVKVESQLREFDGEVLAKRLAIKPGDWYNAKQVEDTVDSLNQTAGTFGYAFADTRPEYDRNKDALTMGVTFQMAEAPRVYVESVDVAGNTLTQDRVIRREMRLSEGDAFNSIQVKRSTSRIASLGYFQEKFEVQQKQGSAPDRAILEANVEEKPTGELQLSAGYSSLERLILQASIQQRNFRGMGQTIGTSISWSYYSKSAQISFTEPYLFDRNVSLGVDIYRRDLNSFNYLNEARNTTYAQNTTGMQIRIGFPLNEHTSLIGRYTLNYDDVSLDQSQYYADLSGSGVSTCEPLLAGRYLCDAIGKRISSIAGLSLVTDTLDNRLHPTRGKALSVSADFAGLGGSVRYARFSGKAAKYWNAGHGFVFSLRGEGGIIESLKSRGIAGEDDVLLTDRFFLGEPQMRGFDIRGIGPRVLREYWVDTNGDGTPDKPGTDRSQFADDALGGRYYYLAHAEMEIPLGSGAKDMGIRPSIFVDAGALWGVATPQTRTQTTALPLYQQTINGKTTIVTNQTGPNGVINPSYSSIPAFTEVFVGNSPKPRISVGIGFNWNSPFGPFRIDIAKAILHEIGDDTKVFTFNVGTAF